MKLTFLISVKPLNIHFFFSVICLHVYWVDSLMVLEFHLYHFSSILLLKLIVNLSIYQLIIKLVVKTLAILF